jgi:myosin heavy subunit
MGKLLRGLAIVLLLLSGVALWLGIYLFGKREELKGRTVKLETAFINLGPFVENEPAEAQPNTFPAKDTADCTAELMETPTKSDFWSNYQSHLEKQDNSTMDVAQRKTDLMSYYKLSPVDFKIERDAQGYKVTDGKGTMQNLLNEVTDKAKNQLDRLNQTRRQLTLVREELVKTIEELNARKTSLREAMNEIVNLKDTIKKLEEKVAGLEHNIRDLEAEKAAMQATIDEQTAKITQLEGLIQDKDAEIKRLEADNKRLRDIRVRIPDGGPESAPFVEKLQPGQKGRVISVNEKYNFAVIQVTDDFISEVTTKEGGLAQGVQLLVKDEKGAFVTKVAVMQINRTDKVAVANNLLDWQQQPLRPGNVVYFQ